MANGQLRADVDLLAGFHARLSAHFAALSAKRRSSTGRPIFALEHSLGDDDLARLKSGVKRVIEAGHIPGDAEWLTLVIYAAEVGYGYSGDEYWHTFESDTPGWVRFGNRNLIRARFHAFHDKFGGAIPTGTWAEHFSIISWPITHAVLPKDLQRHLVRLLFEFRHSLSNSFLENPELLGQKLAGRAAHTSSRFRNFAQNTGLLGQVSVALLTGEEESAYLLNSTLHRIVEDLSLERHLREWLNQAKRTTVQVQRSGFKKPSGTTSREGTGHETRSRVLADPELHINKIHDQCTVRIKLPDLSDLEERLPGVHDELERKRCKLAGVEQPLAKSRVLYPGGTLKLDRMPKRGEPLLSIEDGSPQARTLLSEQVVLSPEPWLFRLDSDTSGVEVLGKFVRPWQSYLLLRRDELSDPPVCLKRVRCLTQGTAAWLFNVPGPINMEMVSILQSLGLRVAHDIEIRPVGFCAAAWDGEGVGEWMTGETPIVGISSTQVVSRCVITLDGSHKVISWAEDAEETFLALNHLELGNHNLTVSLISPEGTEISRGGLVIRIRSQRDSTVGTFGQALRLLSFPAHPTLTEVWEGNANLQILGPVGVHATATCQLIGRGPGEILASESFQLRLPCSTSTWSEQFNQGFRKSTNVHAFYDAAEACEIAVEHPILGKVGLCAERPFSPIRWTIGADENGSYARIIDNTESSNIFVEVFDFSAPANALVHDLNIEEIRREAGGLLRATVGPVDSCIVLPPTVHVRTLDDLRRARVTPRIETGPRTVESIERMIDLAQMWAGAELPGNVLAEYSRDAVLDTIAGNIMGLIGGPFWRQVERRWMEEHDVDLREMVRAVGKQVNHACFAENLAKNLDLMIDLPPESRVPSFVNAVSQHIGLPMDADFGELLLRFASSPGSVRGEEGPRIRPVLQLILEQSVVLRGARLVVLGLYARRPQGEITPYGVWSWS